MELYTLHPSTFRAERIIEGYSSIIWTDRYNDLGDFQIVFPYSFDVWKEVATDTYVGFSESNRVGRIDSSEVNSDDDGNQILTISGKHYETIFSDRTTGTYFSSRDTAGRVAHRIVARTCIESGVDTEHLISQYDIISQLAEGPVPNVGKTIYVRHEDPKNVLEELQRICKDNALGFQVTNTGDESKPLVFRIYQGTHAPIYALDESMDTLSRMRRMKTRVDYKTIAYVKTEEGIRRVSRASDGENLRGITRRILYVSATDLKRSGFDSDTEFHEAIDQRGREALADQLIHNLADGEIPAGSGLRKGTDFNLGDTIYIRSMDGYSSLARITEYTWVSDGSGQRSYPTLALEDDE